jgi:hypothetical protein
MIAGTFCGGTLGISAINIVTTPLAFSNRHTQSFTYQAFD